MTGEQEFIVTEHLKKYFFLRSTLFRTTRAFVHALDDVSFSIKRGETFGLAGESGCGKTTFGRVLLRLIEPTGGKVYFNGVDLLSLANEEMRRLRRLVGIVFQDPKSSLNPRMTIYDVLKRPLEIHTIVQDREEKAERIVEVLEAVGLGEEHLNRYPHELSGGQQQRVSIAKAIITKPELVVLDEPTSSLDISVQAQIVNLLIKLERTFNLTYLFITHDLSVLQYVSDRIGIMYLGKIMEILDIHDLRKGRIFHPYTAYLLLSTPTLNPRERSSKENVLKGDVPSPVDPPDGCRFHPRCPFVKEICRKSEPALVETNKNHSVKCHFPELTESNFTHFVKGKLEMENAYLSRGRGKKWKDQ